MARRSGLPVETLRARVVQYVYVHTGYLRHPKIVGLTVSQQRLHLASILWVAEHETDGYIPTTALRQLHDDATIARRWRQYSVRKLVEARLWDELPEGYHLHNFETHNRSSTRAVVEANRAAALERQRRYRDRVSRRDE